MGDWLKYYCLADKENQDTGRFQLYNADYDTTNFEYLYSQKCWSPENQVEESKALDLVGTAMAFLAALVLQI